MCRKTYRTFLFMFPCPLSFSFYITRVSSQLLNGLESNKRSQDVQENLKNKNNQHDPLQKTKQNKTRQNT